MVPSGGRKSYYKTPHMNIFDFCLNFLKILAGFRQTIITKVVLFIKLNETLKIHHDYIGSDNLMERILIEIFRIELISFP